jgi:prespore-specific regulator
MLKARQDAWTEEDDLLLAETVLRHVREGGTQLRAFEEVGDHLDRTSAAVGFRWNAIVRKKYEQAIKIAKRQRKERQRSMNNSKTPVYETSAKKEVRYDSFQQEDNETSREPVVSNPIEAETEFELDAALATEVQKSYDNYYSSNEQLTLDAVIRFLEQLDQNTVQSGQLQRENNRLQEDYRNLVKRNEELENQLSKLNEQYQNVKEDYEALLQIMDRARRMVLLQDGEEISTSKFKMDKNGNLEKLAK